MSRGGQRPRVGVRIKEREQPRVLSSKNRGAFEVFGQFLAPFHAMPKSVMQGNHATEWGRQPIIVVFLMGSTLVIDCCIWSSLPKWFEEGVNSQDNPMLSLL